jgi:poly(A) polymerase
MQIFERTTTGLTSAISYEPPTREELQSTEKLEEVLRNQNIYELPHEAIKRVRVLETLEVIFRNWIVSIATMKGMSRHQAMHLGGKLLTFGSYHLGVHQRDADIDTLCVAPWIIERKDFFVLFFDTLRKQPEVTDCQSVEEAFVPVIKLKFSGIEIDIVFARLNLSSIPDDLDLSKDEILEKS